MLTLGAILVWNSFLIVSLLGFILFIGGCALSVLGVKFERERFIKEPVENRIKEGSQIINTGGGSYTEQVHGDSINLQNCQIHLGQDLSQLSQSIEEILSQLQKQGLSRFASEEEIIDELKPQIVQDSRVSRKFLTWKRFLEEPSQASSRNIESLKRIAKLSTDASSYSAYDLTQGAVGNYHELEDLLKREEWNEADRETARIVFEYTDIDQVPTSDLRKINQLWVKYSNGKFGFSIQQKIWEKILEAYKIKQELDNDDFMIFYQYWYPEVYDEFLSRVGWPTDEDRIYHVNIQSSLNVPKGHFPVRSFLAQDSLFRYVSTASTYSYFDEYRFTKLMKRDYTTLSVVSSWVTRLLDRR